MATERVSSARNDTLMAGVAGSLRAGGDDVSTVEWQRSAELQRGKKFDGRRVDDTLNATGRMTYQRGAEPKRLSMDARQYDVAMQGRYDQRGPWHDAVSAKGRTLGEQGDDLDRMVMPGMSIVRRYGRWTA